MALNRVLAERKSASDPGVDEASRDQPKDFEFARRQHTSRLRRGRRFGRCRKPQCLPIALRSRGVSEIGPPIEATLEQFRRQPNGLRREPCERGGAHGMWRLCAGGCSMSRLKATAAAAAGAAVTTMRS